MGQLTVLDMNDNMIKNLDENVFKSLTNLKGLYMYENKIEHMDKNLLKYNKKLEELYLDKNKISSLAPEFMSHLKNLVEFVIDKNQITTLSSETFTGNMKLRKLGLKENRIYAIESNTFKKFNQLKYLDLSGNNCIDKSFSSFWSVINMDDVNQNLVTCNRNFKIILKSTQSVMMTTTTLSGPLTISISESAVTNELYYDEVLYSPEDNVEEDAENPNMMVLGLILLFFIICKFMLEL